MNEAIFASDINVANKTNVEEWEDGFYDMLIEAGIFDDYSQGWLERNYNESKIIKDFIRTQVALAEQRGRDEGFATGYNSCIEEHKQSVALAEQRGAERVINAIPYELPLPSPQGLSSITLAPLKQSLKDKFLTNTNT